MSNLFFNNTLPNPLGFFEEPFRWSSGAKHFYVSTSREFILVEMIKSIYGYSDRVIIHGDKGTGKTAIIDKAYSLINYRGLAYPFYIKNTTNSDELIDLLKKGLRVKESISDNEDLISIQREIINRYKENQRVALFFDIPNKVSEEVDKIICILADLKYQDIPILHLYISTSSNPNGRKWKFLKAIKSKLLLSNLSFEETEGLINYRCLVSGRKTPLFTKDGFEKVFELTQGNPEKIMKLCSSSLDNIYKSNKLLGDAEDVLIAKINLRKYERF